MIIKGWTDVLYATENFGGPLSVVYFILFVFAGTHMSAFFLALYKSVLCNTCVCIILI